MGASPLKFMLLVYGVYSTDSTTPSWQTLGAPGASLSVAQMDWIWANYLNTPAEKNDVRVAPLLAPMIGGALLLWFSWHAIFWTMGAAALIGSKAEGHAAKQKILRDAGVFVADGAGQVVEAMRAALASRKQTAAR